MAEFRVDGELDCYHPMSTIWEVGVDTDFDALFGDDDLALDVRGSYLDKIMDGWGAKDAEASVLDEFAEATDDVDRRPMVFLALAYVESTLGRLTPKSKLAAQAAAEAARSHSEVSPLRPKAVEVILRQINGSQPKARRLTCSKPRADVASGDVLAYRSKLGAVHVLLVERIEVNRYYSAPIVQLLDYQRAEIPDAAQLPNLGARPENSLGWCSTRQKVIEANGGERERAGFLVIGSLATVADDGDPNVSSNWSTLAGYIDNWERRAGKCDAVEM